MIFSYALPVSAHISTNEISSVLEGILVWWISIIGSGFENI